MTYADDSTHEFVVDNNGWITKSTDGHGYYTNYTYDNVGRMTRVSTRKRTG